MSFSIQYDWIAYKHVMGIDATPFPKRKKGRCLISRLTFRLKDHLNIKSRKIWFKFCKISIISFSLCYLDLIILLVMSFLSFLLVYCFDTN